MVAAGIEQLQCVAVAVHAIVESRERKASFAGIRMNGQSGPELIYRLGIMVEFRQQGRGAHANGHAVGLPRCNLNELRDALPILSAAKRDLREHEQDVQIVRLHLRSMKELLA